MYEVKITRGDGKVETYDCRTVEQKNKIVKDCRKDRSVAFYDVFEETHNQ